MKIGETQELAVFRDSPHGFFLGDENEVVLLPNNQSPRDAKIGEVFQVFVYTDSEDRPVATLKTPKAKPGEFAKLRVVAITPVGAFFDWGLDKDLLCPMKEQARPLREGDEVVVHVYLDQVSQRVVCSTRLNRYLKLDGDGLILGQKLPMMVIERLPDMLVVILDGRYRASLFKDEWLERLEIGDIRAAYVKQIRGTDGRIAVSLRPQGHKAVLAEKGTLLAALRDAGGTLPVSDHTSPQEIQHRFGMSKGAFKKLLGALYREGKIEIEDDSIRLL
jgi:predicted RNA-binding protein (virulence factor B family)